MKKRSSIQLELERGHLSRRMKKRSPFQLELERGHLSRRMKKRSPFQLELERGHLSRRMKKRSPFQLELERGHLSRRMKKRSPFQLELERGHLSRRMKKRSPFQLELEKGHLSRRMKKRSSIQLELERGHLSRQMKKRSPFQLKGSPQPTDGESRKTININSSQVIILYAGKSTLDDSGFGTQQPSHEEELVLKQRKRQISDITNIPVLDVQVTDVTQPRIKKRRISSVNLTSRHQSATEDNRENLGPERYVVVTTIAIEVQKSCVTCLFHKN